MYLDLEGNRICDISPFEQIELPAKLLDHFLRNNKSNINQVEVNQTREAHLRYRGAVHAKVPGVERYEWCLHASQNFEDHGRRKTTRAPPWVNMFNLTHHLRRIHELTDIVFVFCPLCIESSLFTHNTVYI